MSICPLAPFYLTDHEFCTNESYLSIVTFFAKSWGTLISPDIDIFPRLIHLFFANLQNVWEEGYLVLTSIVKDVRITPPTEFIDNEFIVDEA